VTALLPEQDLVAFVAGQRWFGQKTQEVTGAQVLDAAVLPTRDPELVIALVEIRFYTGTHQNYQLLYAHRDGDTDLDALADVSHARELVHLIRSGATAEAGDGKVEFNAQPGFAALGRELEHARLMGAEQSNTSVVFGEELVLKVYRRLEPGLNPELELLRFLTERGFPNVAPLGGWYAYMGRPLEATLGIVQGFVPDAVDGWELALDELAEAPERFLGRMRRLGEVIAALHTTLGSEPHDPAFAAEEPSGEALGLLTATIDEEIERVFAELPDDEAVAPVIGHGEEVRERLRQLTQVGSFGRVIRHHGDLHLGQTLWAGDDWHVIDFEGEPARSLAERRRKRSPLRDVAGMLRSFAYVTSAASLLRGVEPRADWEGRAREEFLAGYLATVDMSLLPAGEGAIRRLLSIFELEKAVYELRYELDHRPDWVKIPVAGILRLLEEVPVE
jgi:maltokinase